MIKEAAEVVSAAEALVGHWRSAPRWRRGDYVSKNMELLNRLAKAVDQLQEKRKACTP